MTWYFHTFPVLTCRVLKVIFFTWLYELVPKYSELIYNGYWFSKLRKKLQNLIDKTQKKVEGNIKLKLYKGNIIILERSSKKSLYSKDIASFEKAWTEGYNTWKDNTPKPIRDKISRMIMEHKDSIYQIKHSHSGQ